MASTPYVKKRSAGGGFCGPAQLRNFTADLGCVDVDDLSTADVETCEDMGLTAGAGNNRIFDNGQV